MRFGARCVFAMFVVAGAVGCKAGGDDYGVLPGTGGPSGNGSGSGTGVDAPILVGDAALHARVCVMSDPRDLTSCSETAAGGLTVTLGNYQATTADDGTFAIQASSGSALVWHVTGPASGPNAIMPSVIPFAATRILPAISVDRYAQLMGDNGVLLSDQEAVVFARITQAGGPAVGVTATATPVPNSAIFYDGAATTWDQNKTNAYGIVWLPELPLAAGTTAAISIAQPVAGSSPTSFSGIPLENQSLTFVSLDLAPI